MDKVDMSNFPCWVDCSVEKWKDHYEIDQIQISNLGRWRYKKDLIPHEPSGKYPSGGYEKRFGDKRLRIARSVAIAFCPNPLGYKRFAFRDGNNYNLRADNILWCAENAQVDRVRNVNKKIIGAKGYSYKTVVRHVEKRLELFKELKEKENNKDCSHKNEDE